MNKHLDCQWWKDNYAPEKAEKIFPYDDAEWEYRPQNNLFRRYRDGWEVTAAVFGEIMEQERFEKATKRIDNHNDIAFKSINRRLIPITVDNTWATPSSSKYSITATDLANFELARHEFVNENGYPVSHNLPTW